MCSLGQYDYTSFHHICMNAHYTILFAGSPNEAGGGQSEAEVGDGVARCEGTARGEESTSRRVADRPQ